MEIFRILKSVLPLVFAGVIAITVIDFISPTWIIIPGILIGAAVFNRIYTQGGKAFYLLDLSLLITIVVIGGVTAFLHISGCVILFQLSACSPNRIRADIFMATAFPLLSGTVLWLILRLPMIIKSLLKK